MIMNYNYIWQSGIFLVICLTLFYLARMTFKWFNPRVDVNRELTHEDNLAFFFAYIGYFAGFLMVIGGVVLGEGNGTFVNDVINTIVYGIVALVAMNLFAKILDLFVFSKVSMMTEIVEAKSLTMGVVKGGNYLSVGIILSGVLLTEMQHPFEVFVFLILAYLIGLGGTIYYNLITSFDVKKELYQGNLAVACSMTGAQIAFAILIHSGFQMVHESWLMTFQIIGWDVLLGLLILPVVRFIIDKIFLPGRKLSDEMVNQEIPNVGAGIFEGMGYVAGAVLIVWCWHL